MQREVILTDLAPTPIGNYSQAIKCGKTVYLSGQIAINPRNGQPHDISIQDEIHQVFANLGEVAKASGGSLAHVVKLTIYLTDLVHSSTVNRIMAEYFAAPYPARAAIGISSLPNGFRIEAEAVLVLD